jgi:hypothetical protein
MNREKGIWSHPPILISFFEVVDSVIRGSTTLSIREVLVSLRDSESTFKTIGCVESTTKFTVVCGVGTALGPLCF